MGKINRYIWFLIMIIIGGGIGLYYSWYIKPADFVDASFTNLRQDYKTDYVLMVAEIYDQDHNNRLYANTRLDYILDQGETKEEVVDQAITHAEGFGYNPVDLEKMYRLYEMVTGLRPTATPVYDPTKEFTIQQTATSHAISISEGNDPGSTVQNNGAPQADSDPFGTGIQVTTDPSAVPMLDLPSAPTITPVVSFDDEPLESSGGSQGDSVGFTGIPSDFFD